MAGRGHDDGRATQYESAPPFSLKSPSAL